MAFPSPVPGLVLGYAFLWRNEADAGRSEGRKDRPCAIVVTTRNVAGDVIVMLLPITHTRPPNPALAVEIPLDTKRRLGLDEARSWIVVTDLNRFVWPGPDLRPRKPGDAASVSYGVLPAALFREVRSKLARALEMRLAGIVPRDP